MNGSTAAYGARLAAWGLVPRRCWAAPCGRRGGGGRELAHVARRDFAANLLQRLTLAALWFQPAAWALYRHVAREREARCDQLAVGAGASAPALARALVRLAEGSPRRPSPWRRATGMTSRNGSAAS